MRARRWLGRLIGIAFGLLVLEAGSWALLRSAPALHERAALAATGVDPGERTRAAARIGHRFRGGFWNEVVHPYLGFVVEPPTDVDPESIQALGLPWGRELVREHGPDTVVVGLFGGSVAAYLGDAGGVERVAADLADLPLFAGKHVVPVIAAHIGYKQPQSLMALAWLQALGVRFDVVLLLDGFNEVVNAPLELAPAGVFPFFPNHWHQRVANLETNTAMRETIGEIAYRKARRAQVASAFLGSPLHHSSTAELVWALWDRREEAALESARQRFDAGATIAGHDYAATCPSRAPRDPDALADELASFWMESSLEMRALAEARGAFFVHFLQPNQHVPGSKPMDAAERKVAIDGGEEFDDPIVRGYPKLQERGQELVRRGTRFVDLTQMFASVHEPVYMDNIGHLGRHGNELLADAMAAAIREQVAKRDR